MKEERYLAEIVYRNGYSIKIRCKDFNIKFSDGKVTEANWIEAVPNPMLLGIDQIMAVFDHGKE
jgi:hypothetical protein